MKPIMILSFAMLLASCATTTKPHIKMKPITYDAVGASKTINATAHKIDVATTHIDKSCNIINTEGGPSIQNEVSLIRAEVNEITTSTESLFNISRDLVLASIQIERNNGLIKDISIIEQDNDALREENENLMSAAHKQHQAIWMSVVGLSAIGLVIGIVLWIRTGSELGAVLTISSLTLSCISYFMAAYSWVIAIIGGLILLFIIGYLLVRGYRLITTSRETDEKLNDTSSALEESVHIVELLKDTAIDTWSAQKKEIGRITSKKSKELIQDIKTNKIRK